MKAKKYLGQNFLKSESALRKIIEAGNISASDTILEIGPGRGALTEKLLEKSNRIIAVEKDGELVEFLKEKFKKEIESSFLVLVHDDILEFESENYHIENYKVIANIPYNITGAILKKFLTAKLQPERMVLLVQQEVAQRIVARDKKESVLSISVKAYGTPKLLLKVPARYFSPAPKVDSAIIAIENISRDFFVKNRLNEADFWEIIKKGFAHKRKKLSSNLKNLVKKEALLQLGNKRAEDLSLNEWITMV